ncbi:hypothetical protein GcC1_098022 [Golovinomyces cichoracearum]|uniref:Uncharacterized protein n=1 Tax=Golovinomyces cichoracearum TaxID=62708 RepID=A0A420IAE4_9PEZI|nr:hypothetical protein GcC1_098022 [Golovinomyces cichoracearum]
MPPATSPTTHWQLEDFDVILELRVFRGFVLRISPAENEIPLHTSTPVQLRCSFRCDRALADYLVRSDNQMIYALGSKDLEMRT